MKSKRPPAYDRNGIPAIPDGDLLILKEKHGECYYDIREPPHVTSLEVTTPRLHNVALSIVKDRIKAGEWYPNTVEEIVGARPKEPPVLTPKQLKDEALSRVQRDRQRDLICWQRAANEAEGMIGWIKKAKAGDAAAAWALLDLRRDYEYEGFDIETFGEVPE